MRYAGFEPAIPVDSVNIVAVYYSRTTTAACHTSSSTTLLPAANKYAVGAAESIPWFRLFNW
jgi:hypothetical protein